MIINIRGTHGSGKTTLVRTVMEQYRSHTSVYIDDRKAPIGYICRLGRRKLFVAGSYESVTGGCDTIPKVDLMYRMIRRYVRRGYDVLFEGILAQHSTPNILALHENGYDMIVVVIKVPIAKSIRGVKQRRRARGDTRPFNPANVRKEADYTVRAAERLRDAGVRVISARSRRKALTRVLQLLERPHA